MFQYSFEVSLNCLILLLYILDELWYNLQGPFEGIFWKVYERFLLKSID